MRLDGLQAIMGNISWNGQESGQGLERSTTKKRSLRSSTHDSCKSSVLGWKLIWTTDLAVSRPTYDTVQVIRLERLRIVRSFTDIQTGESDYVCK